MEKSLQSFLKIGAFSNIKFVWRSVKTGDSMQLGKSIRVFNPQIVVNHVNINELNQSLYNLAGRKDIHLHLQAERDMQKHNFAFDQQNYSRCFYYQYIFINYHRIWNSPSFKNLFYRRFGANYWMWNMFTAVHGNFATWRSWVFQQRNKRDWLSV